MSESKSSLSMTGKRSALEARRNRRNKKSKTTTDAVSRLAGDRAQVRSATSNQDSGNVDDDLAAFVKQVPRDELLKLVSTINNVYQDTLGRDAPFMTYLILGMQSTGKSTIVERFLKVCLNIVQDGTGTRCPLDITVIHDVSCTTPRCELRGEELEGHELLDQNVQEVFTRINDHTKKLSDEDRFSTSALRLVFRASNVQNMRIVDLPGIISNRSIGKKDNREDIKAILKHEMGKSNAKLCVLLEPDEFATNTIVNFCDETFGGRETWIHDTTFAMTKFDKQMGDTGSGTKANNFFKEFYNNRCYPFLVSTPILEKVDLEMGELNKARLEMLESANDEEKKRFEKWRTAHQRAAKKFPDDEALSEEITKRIGFLALEEHLRTEMLKDIISQLPVVIAELKKERLVGDKELQIILNKEKLADPAELKKLSADFLASLEKLVLAYLSGDLQVTINFPDMPMTLEDEIMVEEESDFAQKSLGGMTVEQEEQWRENLAEIFGDDDSYPATVQPDQKFLGGKQIQRCLRFSREAMIRAIPSRDVLRQYVANCTGYGGSEKENWEGAMRQIVQVCLRQACDPGINYSVRLICCIYRELFLLAMKDAKVRGQESASFKLLPSTAESFFSERFDAMLWKVMQQATDTVRKAIEPLYKTIDPDLLKSEEEDSDEDGVSIESSGEAARDHLIKDGLLKAKKKTCMLPAERTSMVTEEEQDVILDKSYNYVQEIMKHTLVMLRFHFKEHLVQKLEDEMKALKGDVMDEADWEKLAKPDPVHEQQKKRATDKLRCLDDSLAQAKRLRNLTV